MKKTRKNVKWTPKLFHFVYLSSPRKLHHRKVHHSWLMYYFAL